MLRHELIMCHLHSNNTHPIFLTHTITPAEPLPPAARDPPRLPRHRGGPRPHLALRYGPAPLARLARCRRGLLRSAPGRCGRGQPQPGVAGGPGAGCDLACTRCVIRKVGDILSFGARLENIKLFIKLDGAKNTGDLKCPIPVQS
jgi:hypothetical protein